DGGWNRGHRPALYLAGDFEVALAGVAGDFDPKVLQTEFANNFHVRYPAGFRRARGGFVLVKGGPGRRLLRTAQPISGQGAGPGRQAVEGAVAGNARRVGELRRPCLDSTQPASMGGASLRGEGGRVLEGTGVGGPGTKRRERRRGSSHVGFHQTRLLQRRL